MSTEFNPATFEHEGVVYEARNESEFPCEGCAFDLFDSGGSTYCLELGADCVDRYRPDRKNIVWVRAQEGKKA